jgi:hypothetical protein
MTHRATFLMSAAILLAFTTPTLAAQDQESPQVQSDSTQATVPTTTSPTDQPTSTKDKPEWGAYDPAKGFIVVRTKSGEFIVSGWTYARYLNQKAGLERTFTDSFGVTRPLNLIQSLQLNKVILYFKGWVFDPKLNYVLYMWTTNPNQGLGAQVVIAGYLSYRLAPEFAISAGIGGLPTTRSMQGTFPLFLKIDHRTIADEFFRGSYTSGVWADGKLGDKVKYKVMVGNNLSQLAVNAGQLDNLFNTVSGAVWWMPTTGEFGPKEGYGDFEHHDELATFFGLYYTRSREDRQSQPNTDAPENTQIRLSDGTVIFAIDAFGPGTVVERANYRMLSSAAAVKYHGFSLEGAHYTRWVNNFAARGVLPVNSLFDNGFEIQGSAMLKPQKLQTYVAGSKILGQFGNPWDLSVGLSWFPYKKTNVRINGQVLYLNRSPVGYFSVPFALGGTGFVYSLDVELSF